MGARWRGPGSGSPSASASPSFTAGESGSSRRTAPAAPSSCPSRCQPRENRGSPARGSAGELGGALGGAPQEAAAEGLRGLAAPLRETHLGGHLVVAGRELEGLDLRLEGRLLD